MKISKKEIYTIFREADLEGLIGNGAPEDEYNSEANETRRALSELSEKEQIAENIVTIISLAWARSFDLDAEGIKKRLPNIENLVQKILECCSR